MEREADIDRMEERHNKKGRRKDVDDDEMMVKEKRKRGKEVGVYEYERRRKGG